MMRPVPTNGLGTQAKPDHGDIVVFWIVRDSVCGECGSELWKGSFLRMEGERALCLACADLDHLVFLARGDAALTRRAVKYSRLSAVVVRFSRTRKRYERQGILVEEPALARAEQECLADADAREAVRARAAEHRARVDERYVKAFADRIHYLFPHCPESDTRTIADHACEKYSGRVGRSAAAKAFDERAVELAVHAHIRHCHTPYDELLTQGVDRVDARDRVRASVEEVVSRWRGAADSLP